MNFLWLRQHLHLGAFFRKFISKMRSWNHNFYESICYVGIAACCLQLRSLREVMELRSIIAKTFARMCVAHLEKNAAPSARWELRLKNSHENKDALWMFMLIQWGQPSLRGCVTCEKFSVLLCLSRTFIRNSLGNFSQKWKESFKW